MSRLQSFFPAPTGCARSVPSGRPYRAIAIDGSKASKNLLLPYEIGLGYLVIPAASGGLVVDAVDFQVEPLDAATSLWVRRGCSCCSRRRNT